MTDGVKRRVLLKTVASASSPDIRAIDIAFHESLATNKKASGCAGRIRPALAEPPIPTFTDSDFPKPWTCIPFMFNQKYVEYNPEGAEIRKIPGFIVKLPTGDVVAYSRSNPHLGCIFNFVDDPSECAKNYNFKPAGPGICLPIAI